jgi:hypothetical protein
MAHCTPEFNSKKLTLEESNEEAVIEEDEVSVVSVLSKTSSSTDEGNEDERDAHSSSSVVWNSVKRWISKKSSISPTSSLPQQSYMPVSKLNPAYNMAHSRLGKALVLSFYQWVCIKIIDDHLKIN